MKNTIFYKKFRHTLTVISLTALALINTYFNTNATCTYPTEQAKLNPCTGFHNISSTNSALTISWAKGTGGNTSGTIVVVYPGSNVVPPTDGTSYNASSNRQFGYGSNIGGGYVMVNSKDTKGEVDIWGLAANTQYTVAAYAYNSTGYCYKTPAATLTVTTATSCSSPAGICMYAAVNASATTATFQWQNGTGDYNLVVVYPGGSPGDYPINGHTYNANSAYGSGESMQGTGYVVQDAPNSKNYVVITNLTPLTSYYAMVYSYNHATHCYSSNQALDINGKAFTTTQETSVADARGSEDLCSIYSADHRLFINYNNSKHGQAQLSIYNIQGQLLFTSSSLEAGTWKPENGIYLVRVLTTEKVYNKKIIIR
jgi:hypothetical protein